MWFSVDARNDKKTLLDAMNKNSTGIIFLLQVLL